MGSDSDWPTMQAAAEVLRDLDVGYEAKVVSAHRTPDLLFSYAEEARGRGLKAIIAGAGGAAHLPGMLAAKTTVPVLGVPVKSQGAVGPGLAAVHRADAEGHPGRHVRHRRVRRRERRAVRGRHARQRGPSGRAKNLQAFRRRPDGRVLGLELPPLCDASARVDRMTVILRRRRSVSSAAGSSAGTSSSRRASWATRPGCSTPTSRARRAASPTGTSSRAYDDPAALDEMGDACAAVTTEFENVPGRGARPPRRD